jgi:membrane protein DedA with SNARE-associated domain
VPVGSLSGHLTSLIGDHALYAVFGLMLVDAVLPAFSELVMVYGGAVAAGAFSGQTVSGLDPGFESYLAIALAGTIGYLLGSILGWGIGRYARPFVETHGRWIHLSPKQLGRAEGWFERWGDWAVLIGRVTPVARSFISIPAGLFRMSLARYTALTAIGSALWAFALAGVGWAAGSNYERIHNDFRYVDYAVAAGLIALVAYLIVRKRSSRLRARAEDPTH